MHFFFFLPPAESLFDFWPRQIVEGKQKEAL